MHEVLANRLGGLSLPRKSVVRFTDRPYMTLDVYRGRKTTNQQQQQLYSRDRGWPGGAMVLGKLPVPGRPTIWVIVGLFGRFSLLYPFFSFSLSLGDGPI